MPPPFTPFGPQHLVPVGLAGVIMAALAGWARRQPDDVAARGGRALAWILLAYYAVESVVRVQLLGVRAMAVLPFELCNALTFVGAFAYFTGSSLAFEMLYFWTFAGTIHAFLTPTPRAGFPDPNYFQYFFAHGLLLLSAVYAAVGMRKGPKAGSMLRAYLALQAFTAGVAVIDLLTGENYLYLRHKPPSPTLLDALGPWPVYLFTGQFIAIGSFLLWNTPHLITLVRARRNPS